MLHTQVLFGGTPTGTPTPNEKSDEGDGPETLIPEGEVGGAVPAVAQTRSRTQPPGARLRRAAAPARSERP